MDPRPPITARSFTTAAFLLLGCSLISTASPPAGQATPGETERRPGLRLAQVKVQVPGRIRGNVQVQAQVDPNAASEEEEGFDARFVQPDRDKLQVLSRAERLLKERRFGEAARDLGAIIGAEEDGALPNEGGTRKQGVRFLKAEALRLLAEMPREGREAYELRFGAESRQRLDAALAGGDVTAIEEVVRRYFHTHAGFEAAHVLGQHHLDHGRPLAAALTLQRLANVPSALERFDPLLSFRLALAWHRSGMSDQAKAVLVGLKQRQPDASILAGGREVPLFAAEEDAVAWLTKVAGTRAAPRAAESDRWAMFRGGPTRNAPSPGGRPLLNYRWRVQASSDPFLIEYMGRLRETHLDQNVTAIPAMNPLAVGGAILMRTSHNLLAVDFQTGKRIWEVSVDDAGDPLAAVRGSGNAAANATMVAGLERRLWQDATFGTLSSDGDLVFSIEDLSIAGPTAEQQKMIVGFNGRRRPDGNWPKKYNRLAAHELKTEGKLKWALGGAPGDDELPEAGAFFLGPPLPLAGRLYALAEIKEEIRLLAINPRKSGGGERLVEWSLPLAAVELSVFDNADRRLAGVSPSYADGVLVCPTGAGMVVGVDLTSRSLLWGRTYPPASDQPHMRMGAMRMQIWLDSNSAASHDGWIDSSVTLADGRALITPVEGDRLLCLGLSDGELAWEKTRQECKDGLYLGCVADGRVLVVGRTHVVAFRLVDGQPLWEQELPAGGSPSGRGFFHEGWYYLPMSTAEVLPIELATGNLGERARSRQGIVPGNLICYQGAVISQGVDSVDCFYQAADVERQIAAALQARPDDPAALALSGEVLLDQGRLEEAQSHLRRSFERDSAPRTRELLVDALLEGLRSNFVANQAAIPEIERLLERPEQWDVFLRLIASGLHAQGDHPAAFDAYLRLAELKLDPRTLGRTEPSLSVRRDRWVQARLAALRDSASAADREAMDALVASRRQAAFEAGTAEALQQFLSFFGNQPSADEVRLALAGRLSERQSALEIELLLSRIARSEQAELAGAATARLAELLARSDRPDQAAWFYRRLMDQFADVACQAGQTGRQIVDGLPSDGPLRTSLSGAEVWPVGLVETTKQAHQGASYPVIPVDFDGVDPWVGGATIRFDPQRNTLVGRDEIGRPLWSVPLADVNQQNNFGLHNPGTNRARAQGHLLVAVLGFQVLAIDTLGGPKGTARILWKEDLSGTMPGAGMMQFGIQQMRIMVPWGGQPRVIAADPSGRPLGMIGPCTTEQVCLIRGRSLIAFDLLTGQHLWVRQGIPANSQVFGDDEVVIVAPSDGEGEAIVLRALDGMELDRVSVPSANERMATIGRHVLRWTTTGSKSALALYDPWKKSDDWTREFSIGSKAALIGQEQIGIAEPEGRFSVLDLADGRPLLQGPIERRPDLSEIYILPSRNRLVLIVNSPLANDPQVAGVQPVPGGPDNPTIYDGAVYAFDRHSGERLWRTNVRNQGLMLSQPGELPVLVFASHIYKRDGNAQNIITVASVLCLDKRNGRVLYKDESPNAISTFDLAARPDARTVELKLPQQTLSMKFTDQPLPAEEPPADAAPAEGAPPQRDKSVLPEREDVNEDR
jgi:outer membrane protein assembly factor BamB